MIYHCLRLGNHLGESCDTAKMSMIGHDCGDVVKTTLTCRSNRAHWSPPSPFLTEIEGVDFLLSKTEAHQTDGGVYLYAGRRSICSHSPLLRYMPSARFRMSAGGNPDRFGQVCRGRIR
jgi:hypothetical protein